MKKHSTKFTLLMVTLTVTLLLGGCSSDSNEKRLTALEAEVAALKAQNMKQAAAFKKELGQIRKNLDGIHDILALDKVRPKTQDSASSMQKEKDQLDDELDVKAKNFVSENLDRLLGITKKLLDQMENEIDEHMKKNASEAPKAKDETI